MDPQDVFEDPPVLRTDRLILRQINGSDGEGLFGIFADDAVTKHYAWDAFTSIEQGHALAVRAAEQFRRREAIRWGLLLPGSSRIIGTCGYTRWSRENRFAILGYDLARAYWRRGLMSEAVTAVLRTGFGQMALHRVEATVMVGNTASAALLDRAGFAREGVLRERALKGGVSGTYGCSALRGPTGHASIRRHEAGGGKPAGTASAVPMKWQRIADNRPALDTLPVVSEPLR